MVAKTIGRVINVPKKGLRENYIFVWKFNSRGHVDKKKMLEKEIMLGKHENMLFR